MPVSPSLGPQAGPPDKTQPKPIFLPVSSKQAAHDGVDLPPRPQCLAVLAEGNKDVCD